MVRVTLNQTANISTNRGHVAIVPEDVPHLLTDIHAAKCIPSKYCSARTPFEQYHHYRGEDLSGKSLAVVWVAGLGDTISAATALMSLQAAYPDTRIDVVSVPMYFEIFRAAGFKGQLVPYPPPLSALETYDFLLPTEGFGAHEDRAQLDSIDLFAKLFHQPYGLEPVQFSIDPSVRRALQLPPSSRPRIGVQVRGWSPMRTYPIDLLSEVMKMMVQANYEVHLLGTAGNCDIPSAPPLLFNHCGLTPTFAHIVSLLGQMDAAIVPDSFLMHLAGSLKIPTVALFSTIPARLRISHYASITALEPDAPCAPCEVINDLTCPLGHSECVAMRAANMSPNVVMEAVEQALARARIAFPISEEMGHPRGC